VFNQFLNLIIGDDQFKVGHDLNSETANIQEFQFPYEDEGGNKRLLCLLDTPGFGDTYKLYVLRTYANNFIIKLLFVRFGIVTVKPLGLSVLDFWDGKKVSAPSVRLGCLTTAIHSPKITGIIYFHNINEPRVTHLAYRAKEIFYDICGGDAMRNVILCTSQWDKLMDKAEGERRESQLLGEFWKKMIDDNARTARHNNTRESAGRILELILGSNPVTPKLVTELKVEGITLGDTSAGRLVADFNTAKAKEIELSVDEVKKSLEAANMRNERLKAERAEDERKWAQRESEVLAHHREAMRAAIAGNEAEKLRAELERKEAEVKLENERKEREAQQKAKEGRMQATILRAQEEMQRLEAALKRTQREKEVLEKRFDMVEYAKNVGQRVLGEKLGRFVGGVWGYAARFGFGTADLLAEFTGGKKFGERKQEVMEWIGHAVERGNEEKGLIGAASGFVLSSARGVVTAISDIQDTTDDGEKEALNCLSTITLPGTLLLDSD